MAQRSIQYGTSLSNKLADTQNNQKKAVGLLKSKLINLVLLG